MLSDPCNRILVWGSCATSALSNSWGSSSWQVIWRVFFFFFLNAGPRLTMSRMMRGMTGYRHLNRGIHASAALIQGTPNSPQQHVNDTRRTGSEATTRSRMATSGVQLQQSRRSKTNDRFDSSIVNMGLLPGATWRGWKRFATCDDSSCLRLKQVIEIVL